MIHSEALEFSPTALTSRDVFLLEEPGWIHQKVRTIQSVPLICCGRSVASAGSLPSTSRWRLARSGRDLANQFGIEKRSWEAAPPDVDDLGGVADDRSRQGRMNFKRSVRARIYLY
jgi:hypothetical protein